MNDPKVLSALEKAIYDHVWGDNHPADEAKCCAPKVLQSLAEQGYTIVQTARIRHPLISLDESSTSNQYPRLPTEAK